MQRVVCFIDAVYNHGGICLDILQNQWSPIYDVSAVLTSIQVCKLMLSCVGTFCLTTKGYELILIFMCLQSLLSDPNANSPANSDAARLFSEDRYGECSRLCGGLFCGKFAKNLLSC